MDADYIATFIDNFKKFPSYDEQVSFAFETILNLPNVKRFRYGKDERYCVFYNQEKRIAVLAQCGRYESEMSSIQFYYDEKAESY